MQAGVRSTAHRRGITANPCWPAGLRTISIVLRRIWLAHSNRRPANPPSAKKNRTRGTQGGMQQDRFRTVAVLGGSGQHDHNQEQAEGVGDDEPLPAVDLLAGVVPTTVPADGVGALHTLRIDQPGAGLRIATLLYPQLAANHRQAWGANRRVRAQVLFQLLTGYGPQLADPVVAVRLRGAHVVGRLNLGGSTLSCALE
jgi:hypothetical protein